MIASVRGEVLAVGIDRAVVETGGIGLAVLAAPSTLALLRVGEHARLHTTLVVREDSLTLYGFADADERETFETVQTVSGIGPRTALAMLAVLSPDALRGAVAEGNLTTLMKVPGIGRKGAQRLVLELADRLGPVRGSASVETAVAPVDHRTKVVEALEGLGWTARTAEDAVGDVLAARGVVADEPLAEGDVPDVLRAALRMLGGRRG
ncbi:Holliday junction branch migration protein RuvA [Flavimobilis sp. GY10621]|uniref:Holliday junction branch migration complex subunit RuvA n=1 Tax=Flavimobilis rhizosphaerae TaxID=2775421 RepID=A0ABR9DT94_9MICO|nr:Holliday junction branch migration protein RuvA [Flavimobilis rhizosphaerae]MBD9700350.1 Holliday junction branch migration protein RuvA [Flavimobilis rhizosphaerae]